MTADPSLPAGRDVVHSLSDTEGSDDTTTPAAPAERDEPVTAAGRALLADLPSDWESHYREAILAIEREAALPEPPASPEGAEPTVSGEPSVIGWFDSAGQTEPAFDPGLDVPCIVCWRPLTEQPRVTISLMWADRRDRSYFIRAHKPCWESLTASEQQRYEESVLTA